MRNCQINLTLRRYSEGVKENLRTISVYSDSNNDMHAISSAFASLINILMENEKTTARTDIFTKDTGITGEMLGNAYFNDARFDYVEQRIVLYKELVNYIENSSRIFEIISTSRNKEVARHRLRNEYGYNDEQISFIFRIRFDMLTISETEILKNDIDKMLTIINERRPYKNND